MCDKAGRHGFIYALSLLKVIQVFFALHSDITVYNGNQSKAKTMCLGLCIGDAEAWPLARTSSLEASPLRPGSPLGGAVAAVFYRVASLQFVCSSILILCVAHSVSLQVLRVRRGCRVRLYSIPGKNGTRRSSLRLLGCRLSSSRSGA